MLKRLHVNNFKSLVNVEFQPAGVNVLVGRNNSGKTNLCAAMRFLGLTASGPLRDAIRKTLRENWNITSVYLKDRFIEIEVDCALPCEGGQVDFNYSLQLFVRTSTPLGEQSLEVAKEELRAGQEVLLIRYIDFVVVAREGMQEVIAHFPKMVEEYRSKHMPEMLFQEPSYLELIADRIGLKPEAAVDAQETTLSQLVEPRSALFRRYLQSWAYYSLSPVALRSKDVSRSEPGLLADGSNLCGTMFRLHNEKPRLEKQIIEIVKSLEPKLDLLTYSFPDPESVFMFIEDQEAHRFGTQSISDGTLRFMAMTYLILAAAERDENEPPPLIIIEEPENGLYVGHLKPLIERIDKNGKGGQFIFTTHSPYFIDLFDGMLEGVHLMKPGKPSSLLTKPDPERMRKLLEKMSLGELHFREMLG